MKRLIIIISLIFAQAGLGVTYKIAGEFHELFQKDGVRVSKPCAESCLALKKLEGLKKSGLPKSIPDGKSKLAKSTGTIACGAMGGKAVFGVDEKKNMMALCRFEDESMIDYASLEEVFGSSL